ncbi:alkaline phosphatase family protein [Terasakiella pusilla]|uniref:alkaline phosphatase family protein n=1 Tax=Terasakiella pusilla TaxID=64973 RepID=UPI003AA90E17
MPVNSIQNETVLAGPILRRTNTKQVAIWLALSTPARARITFTPDGGTPIKVTLKEDTPDCRLIQAGTHLYYLLIDAHLPEELPSDTWIDYKLELGEKVKGHLRWRNVCAPNSDLYYDGRKSLGFKIPSRVQSLLHGSCRKPHHDSEDGLVESDKLIGNILSQNGEDLPDWPSMLVLTGDQVYADDVAGPMLHAIHQIIAQLGLNLEEMKSLKGQDVADSQCLYEHEDCYYNREKILPKTQGARQLLDLVFEGVKKPIFTTDTAHNHLITIAEHLVMYLMVWSPTLWPFVDTEEIPKGLSTENAALYRDEQKILDQFIQGLTKVQRVFAHLPVAMIFDDHDVTDDWNLNRQWEEAVYNNPFSKRMIGNALTSYLLNQGWGNNPSAFDDNMMGHLTQSLKEPGRQSHEQFINDILGFENWEYTWESSPPLIVIDTRTRRWRSESSAVRPSGLLDWEAVTDLQQRLRDQDNVLLVSPAPIFGVKLIETIQRIFTWFGKPLVVDAENWMAHPGTANSILNVFMHRNTPENFVILSGDVHYSFVYDVELRRIKGGPDIWQITSSGLRNEFPHKLLNLLDVANKWLFAPKSPLNWLTKRRHMRIIPRKPEGRAHGHRTLNGSGVGLVELDENGRPWRIRQLIAGGNALGFERMEDHSRWE